MDRFKLIASVYLLLIEDEKILLLRRFNTGYEDGKYSLPAGHLEDNESLTNGLIREVKEEIGIDLQADGIKLVHVMHRKEKDIRIDFFFTAVSYNGTPFNNEVNKCDDVSWYKITGLPKNTIYYIKKAIVCYRNGQFFSETGWK